MMMLICIKQYLSNIWSSIHERVKQHWGWVEKGVAYKESVYFVGTSNDPRWKKSLSRPDFVDSEIVIWGMTSLTDFHKRIQRLFKKQRVSDCQKKTSFVQITHLKFTFLTLDYIKSYY